VAVTQDFMQSRKHAFEVRLPNERIQLYADPVRFEQIIVNLLNNAIKYTPPSGNIKLICERDENILEVRVEDTGVGIAESELTAIFEPFRQLRSAPHVGTGLGVGLSITKQLAEMHGGLVKAKSEGLGKGSTFVFRLPLPEDYLIVESVVKPVTKLDGKAIKNYKILVVDDNQPAAEILGKLLEFKGHKVNIVYTGQGALKAVSDFGPEIVLLDIGLPDIDGYEVAKQLRGKNYDSKLIALTGYGQDEDKSKARAAGFDHHLTKPVALLELENVLAKTAI
jgi:CheY-like chemotaxis protein